MAQGVRSRRCYSGFYSPKTLLQQRANVETIKNNNLKK
jgi:hypothetical protein